MNLAKNTARFRNSGLIIASLLLAYTSMLRPSSGEEKPLNASEPLPNGKLVTSSTNQTAGQSGVPRSSTMLYGRIEQIAGSTGAQFPVVLRAQTAKLDARQKPKVVQQGQASFSGLVVRSFPQQFSGVWGGHLKIWTSQIDSICWQIDPDEATRTRQLLTPGKEGSVNFDFAQSAAGKIDLEPAQVVFMVPMKETHIQDELNGMLGGNGLGQSGMTLPGMDSKQLASMMQQVAGNMNVPIMINFGSVSGSGVEGVSGNAITATVLSNTIRQLNPGVLEQQIVTQESQRNNKTGKVRQEYSETVLRFTSQSNNSLYVQAAAVNYTSNRQFERKLILYGTIHRGQAMPEASNPMGGLTNMMPGNSQHSQMPGGINPLQGLFPRQ